jgi:hypothetical protein
MDIVSAEHIVEGLQPLRAVRNDGGEMWEVTENAGHESSPCVLRFGAKKPKAKRHGVLVSVISEQSTQLPTSVGCEVRRIHTGYFGEPTLRPFGSRRRHIEGDKATSTYGASGLSSKFVIPSRIHRSKVNQHTFENTILR